MASAGEQPPAVAATNFKLDAYGGLLDTDPYKAAFGGATGSVTLPIAYAYGLEVAGAAGTWGHYGYAGAAAQFFWRNPDVALLGLYGGYYGSGSLHVGQVAPTAEVYLNRFTLKGALGWEGGDVADRAFGNFSVSYYPIDNVKLSAGYVHTLGMDFLTLGAEALKPISAGAAVSMFGEARFADNRQLGLVGLRLYFGPKDSTLIDRHRREDPSAAEISATQALFTALLLGETQEVSGTAQFKACTPGPGCTP